MSVPEMGKMLGLGKVESYWLVKKNYFKTIQVAGRMRVTSLKLKLSSGNIKAVQGDTGHAEARMVTDTYAHGFDEDRKLIAHEMDSGFFSKVGGQEKEETDNDAIEKLKILLQQHPELLPDILDAAVRTTAKTGEKG